VTISSRQPAAKAATRQRAGRRPRTKKAYPQASATIGSVASR
jgi:hypothetical protein